MSSWRAWCGRKRNARFFREVLLVSLPAVVALLIGAVASAACRDKPTTGTLVIAVSGLPAGAPAGISVLGPDQLIRAVDATTTFENLPPGQYTVVIRTVRFGSALYTATVAQRSITLAAGRTEIAEIPFVVGSGSVKIAVSGLPPTIEPSLRLTCALCGGFSRVVTSPGVVSELPPGQYVLRADTLINIDDDRFGATAYEQSLVIPASLTPVNASVTYALASGGLAVSVDGLAADGQTPSPITITGPGSFRQTLAVSTTMRGLPAGTYTIVAATAHGTCPNMYRPGVPVQTASVAVGSTTPAVVTYASAQAVPGELNVRIDAVHLIQVVQDYNGSTPAVAGKRALLRVFAIANQCNTARPLVRVTLSGIPNARTFDLETPAVSVSTRPDPGTLIASYNAIIPAADVRPGLNVSVELDPTGLVAEANEQDNRFPASGSNLMDVRVVPSMGLLLVPVAIGATLGNVAAERVDSLVDFSRAIHPAFSYEVVVGSVFTSTAQPLQSNSVTGWSTLLSELDAKRVADRQNNGVVRYYHGIVPVSYRSGIAGIGYIGGKTALTWDRLPSATEIMAHELGHNFGRFHAPCGNPDGPDKNYPSMGTYAGGHIGQYGIDLRSMELKQPQFFSDVMGYCSLRWVSDYTYMNTMQWLIDHPSSAGVVSAGVEPALLVWGRIENGQPILEPAFELTARAQLPDQRGPHRLAARDETGAEIFTTSFTGQRIADLPAGSETFAFAIPTSKLGGRRLGSLTITANGHSVTSSATGDVTVDTQAVLTRAAPHALRLRWNAGRFPAVLVRDAVTGEVLSFARGGDATIVTLSASVELIYSNRVRSARDRPPLR